MTDDDMTPRQQNRGHPMFPYLILVGVASEIRPRFRIRIKHLLAISANVHYTLFNKKQYSSLST